MKTVTNANELTTAILEQLSEMFTVQISPYTYSVLENGNIIIYNDENAKCMEISSTEITTRDIIQDAYNDAYAEELVKIRQTEVNELFDIFDGLSDFGKIKVHAEPSITYITFKYFDTLEEWKYNNDIDSTNILPFEVSNFVQKIKDSIIKDLGSRWKMH
jgi:hypothetical protein